MPLIDDGRRHNAKWLYCKTQQTKHFVFFRFKNFFRSRWQDLVLFLIIPPPTLINFFEMKIDKKVRKKEIHFIQHFVCGMWRTSVFYSPSIPIVLACPFPLFFLFISFFRVLNIDHFSFFLDDKKWHFIYNS